MADVPAWVLIINTVAVGGFGLASAYLLPRSQREARLHESKRADAAVMREKAGEILKELAALDSKAGDAVMKNVISLLPEGNLDPDAKIPSLEDLRALLAVYFPGALTILDDHDQKVQDDLKEIRVELAKASESSKDASGKIAAVRVMMVFQVWTRIGATTKKIKLHMIDAVKPYVPVLD